MLMVPTINHSLFDGTQTSMGPLKLRATYLGNALVCVVGCFAIAKHPATHTKAMPKYAAPNLREPKLVWVPSKNG